jgi:hypothetical protein
MINYTTLAVIAIVAVIGLLGLVVAETVSTPQQEAQAKGVCGASSSGLFNSAIHSNNQSIIKSC